MKPIRGWVEIIILSIVHRIDNILFHIVKIQLQRAFLLFFAYFLRPVDSFISFLSFVNIGFENKLLEKKKYFFFTLAHEKKL